MEYVAGTQIRTIGWHGQYIRPQRATRPVLVQQWYISEQGATASNPMEWQATNGMIGMVRLCQYQTRPNGVVRGLSTAMYRVA